MSNERWDGEQRYVDGAAATVSGALALKMDQADSSVLYVGEASIESLTSAPVWRIKKLTTVGGLTDLQWADKGKFSQVWDDHLNLTYS